jgi:predicted RNA-binding Zn-ribbon protein involved in translation (DUF1610 family)
MIDNENLSSNGTNQKYMCPICGKELEKTTKETTFFNYYKCPTCSKVFRKKKLLDTEESIFLIGEELHNIKFALYCITFIVVLWFIISFILTFVIR